MKLLSLISLLLIAAPFAAYGAPTYVIKKGETLSKIANDNGVPLTHLIKANPQIVNPNWIYPGQVINFPEADSVDAAKYVVKPGDILFNIAREHGYSLDDVIKANPQINNPNLIYPGQIIHFPEVKYVVKSGDTLDKIAQENGLTLQRLISANPQIPDPDNIYPGQKINIPK